MKRFALFAAAALMGVGTGAKAGSLAEPVVTAAPEPVFTPAPVPVSADWTGFYAGGSLGYADVTEPGTTLGDEVNGLTYGVHAGYDYDFGALVLGGEVEYSLFDVTDAVSGLEVDSVTRLKVRAGYDAGDFLPYATFGGARLATSGIDGEDEGYFYGVGADYRMTDSIRVGAELLRHEFDDYAGTGVDVDATTLGARVSFQF